MEIIGAIHEPDVSLVMEYVQHGSLQTYLKINKETLKTETLLKFALDVACVSKSADNRTKFISDVFLFSRNNLFFNLFRCFF